MPNTHTQVLIVGAGPTGLALANLLATHGIAFRIIDKNSERSNKSKALGVQAGSLEAIKHHLGEKLANDMVAAGLKVQSVLFNFYDQNPVKVDLSLIPSFYNCILILPQSENERLLEKNLVKLGSRVERECELIALTQNAPNVSVTLKTNSGTEENLTADYVVGCDGASSMVRKLLQLPFSGGEYTGNFILGDVRSVDLKGKNSIEIFITDKGALAYFPLETAGLGRFVLIPKNQERADTREISLADFSRILNELSPRPIQISEAPWLSRFTLHHRIVSHFQTGRVFLAGDAAHIHSPLGGQGMNTGIQDAFNLGFKLAQVLSGKADSSSLALYEKQRYPVAKNILRGTDLGSRLLLLNDSFAAHFFKQHVMPHLLKVKWVQKKLVTAISEIRIAQEEIKREN